MRIKAKVAKGILAALILTLIPVGAYSAQKITPGSACKVYKQKLTYLNKSFTCIKVKKKLVWDKGVAIKQATPTPTQSAVPTPTQSATPTPTPTPTPEIVTIEDNEWSLAPVLDGYIVNIAPFTTTSKSDAYSDTEVWESTSLSGTFNLVAKGTSPIVRFYVADLSKKYVKIRHKTKAGIYSNFSVVKTISSASPGGFDATGPTNNSVLTVGIPAGIVNTSVLTLPSVSVDADSQFVLAYKILLTWNENSDATTAGYKIRFKISNSAEGYINTQVFGKKSTSTILFGLSAGRTYEIGLNVFDNYGNAPQNWSTITVTTPN
ncbi:unannotated protein [freshwater metagenome]|uniref:Unannotated protein n=1 Tax=freshwater metagenome TaxID=449393 RepID=A0A6J6WF38_9ZZZZ|nr:hypothetical protein [Actinomycetota bacterium]MTB05198.1 hypothetical protein [Actinomycetota bacterium]